MKVGNGLIASEVFNLNQKSAIGRWESGNKVCFFFRIMECYYSVSGRYGFRPF